MPVQAQETIEITEAELEVQGPQIAARFIQVDNQIKNLLDLQIAMQLPLIQSR